MTAYPEEKIIFATAMLHGIADDEGCFVLQGLVIEQQGAIEPLDTGFPINEIERELRESTGWCLGLSRDFASVAVEVGQFSFERNP